MSAPRPVWPLRRRRRPSSYMSAARDGVAGSARAASRRAIASSLRARRPSIGASRASARWRTAGSGPWARSPSSKPDRGALLARVRQALRLEELLLDGERRHGQPGPTRQIVHALARGLAPRGGGRLDPAAPEVGDGLGDLAPGPRAPRPGGPESGPPPDGPARGPGTAGPRTLGVGPPAQPEHRVVSRELRLGQRQESGKRSMNAR